MILTSLLGSAGAKLGAVLDNPKVRKAAIAAGSYYAGAHGGPLAKQAVESRGPEILDLIVFLLGGAPWR